jgi:hypothetical protein
VLASPSGASTILLPNAPSAAIRYCCEKRPPSFSIEVDQEGGVGVSSRRGIPKKIVGPIHTIVVNFQGQWYLISFHPKPVPQEPLGVVRS